MPDQLITFAGKSGIALAASVRGPEHGFPVILAHGGGQTRRAWKGVTELLASHGFRTIAVDLRGHGDSEWARDGAYDISDFATDLAAVASAVGNKPALIGASLGGMAGIIAEGEYAPGTFGSLTLVDITPQMEPGGVTRVLGFMTAHAREGRCQSDEERSLLGGSRSLSKFSQAARVCHSAQAAERRCL
jgi:pimeloyl-ACP methyl ester carboxylesterase